MFNSKISKAINVSHFEFTLSNFPKDEGDLIGKASFFVNGFIQFRNIPIRKNPDGELRVDFSAVGNGNGSSVVASSLLRGDIRKEIEHQVTEKLVEMVP